MKKLPFYQRPDLWRRNLRILEIGGGGAPFAGITHAVDKFPDENCHRTGDLVVPKGVTFREGELEAIPFTERFDFAYVSHVFEHVQSPILAARELSRVADRGYIETPSPFREQLWEWPSARADRARGESIQVKNTIHTYFLWTASEPDTLHYIKKTPERLGEFCSCPRGQTARTLCDWHLKSEQGSDREAFDLEPFLPRGAKTTQLHFRHGVWVIEHPDFESACRAGACAYRSLSELSYWLSAPMVWFFPRFQALRQRCLAAGVAWR